MRKYFKDFGYITILALLSVFIYSGGMIKFVNWYIHSLDFMKNETLELVILGVILVTVDVLVFILGCKLDQKKNLD